MTINRAAVGHDHAEQNSTVDVLIALFCLVYSIPVKALNNCTFRKSGQVEFQPDLAYYFGDRLRAIPEGTTIVDLDRYPVPDLVIEIAHSSLNLDVGLKRLCYETLGIREYWVVNVPLKQVCGLAILNAGSQQIRESGLLPGLNLDGIEAALVESQSSDRTTACGAFMQRLGASLPRLDSSSS